jgi:Photosynthesis system II assembly factor YCF48
VTNQKPDRDATIDRLLAGRATRNQGNSADACLDADTLAAWADGALDAGALATAEAHAADCARCQAMLAAMARTTPLAPAQAVAPWWKPAFRWFVPLTAAAAAVLVWTMVPPRDGQVTVHQVSESADATPPPPVATPSSREPAAIAVVPPTSAVTPTPRRETQKLAEAKEVDLSRQTAETMKADLSHRSAEGAKAENDKKSPAAADASALADASARADRARPAGENAAAAPAAPAQPMAKTFSFGAPDTVVVSSNPASRWRILQGGQVQRSADGGATWQTQTTGVSDTLSGGSSPSPSVCWLVGPRGIVLRTTDGRSWTRIPFPEAVPLTSIRATDNQTATVTTEDGRQFVTENGGRTWSRKEF